MSFCQNNDRERSFFEVFWFLYCAFQGLSKYWKDKCEDACDCISQEDKRRFLISCPLRKIQIKGFKGTKTEMGVLEHYLEHFPSLKEIEIYAGEKCPTDVSEYIVKMVNLYNESCVVHFLVCDSSYRQEVDP